MAYCLAADYSDEWTCVRKADGSIKSALRSFHICMSGGSSSPCCTVVESKKWLRMKEEGEADAWVAGQRWYCNCCTARYRPKFGMLNEVSN